MTENPDVQAPTGLASVPMYHWLVSGAGLLWNILGLWIYVTQVRLTPEQLAAQFEPQQVEFLQAIPAWATAANAIAVNAGVIACILLLMRKALAMPFFLLSLAALIVQDLYSFVLVDVIAVMGQAPAYIQGTVLLIAISLVLYTRSAKARGLLT